MKCQSRCLELLTFYAIKTKLINLEGFLNEENDIVYTLHECSFLTQYEFKMIK